MQIDDILLLRMNRQYLFAPAKDEFTVLCGLCGLQAQFYGNCLHALRLRCGKAPDEDILRTSAVKTWTLRGTLHLIAQSDLPIFLYDGRSHFLRPCDTMENDDHLSAARKRELAAIILDAAQKGCGGREELRLLCREHGMTADEEQSAFDPWGGLLRALCESGVLCHTAQQKKAFRPCPPFDPDNAGRCAARAAAPVSDTLRPRNSTGRSVLLRSAPARAAAAHRISLPARIRL